MMKKYLKVFLGTVVLSVLVSGNTNGQAAIADELSTMSGTVSSYTRNTLVIRTDAGAYQLFVFDSYTTRPTAIATGSTVRVISHSGTEPGVRVANTITMVSGPPAAAPATASDPVPTSVRKLEDQIERQSRKYGMGVRGGAGLDPEILTIGVHGRFGPFFDKGFSFRPNGEFGFGEVTKLFALNLEGVYTLPITTARSRWSSYIGAGPSFIFSHQNFERAASGENGIDFGDFNYNTGLNVLAGVEFRSGVFFEVKSTVYASPHLRLLVGYTF